MEVTSFRPCAAEKTGSWIQVFGGEQESVETILLDVAICCPTQLQWEVNVYRNSLPKIFKRRRSWVGHPKVYSANIFGNSFVMASMGMGLVNIVVQRGANCCYIFPFTSWNPSKLISLHGLLLNSIESPVWEGHFYSKTQPGNPPRLLICFFLRWGAICVILFHVHRKGNRKRKESKSNQQVFNNHMNEIICIINCHTKNLIRNNWKPVFSIPQDSH